MKLAKLLNSVQTDLQQNIYFIMVEDLPVEYKLPLLRREEEIINDFRELFMGFMYRNMDKKRKYMVYSCMIFGHIIIAADTYQIIDDERLQDDTNLAIIVDLRN